MAKNLNEIAQDLKDDKHITKAKKESKTDLKVQLIYAFNGTGKTRLSKAFKTLVEHEKNIDSDETDLESKNILYYNAFTEDLFYWDNDLANDTDPKLKIHPNMFTKWVFEDQGQDVNVIRIFQHYTNEKLTPHLNAQYTYKNNERKDVIVNAFTEVTFSYERGNEESSNNIKISKGEESCFIWSIFYSLIAQVVDVLNVPEENERETNKFDNLEYVFIDDPVSSLDENHLIGLAVDLAQLIKSSKSNLKFIITTHNPLFYNVLYNEFKDGKFKKYILKKDESNKYDLVPQRNDSPFSYHLLLKTEIEDAIKSNNIQKYHFNFFRNILEKTSTFLGYENWGELLPKDPNDNSSVYENKIKQILRKVNINSHSKHSADEISMLEDSDKKVLEYLLDVIKKTYGFK